MSLEFSEQILSMLERRIIASRFEKIGHIRIIAPCHDSAVAYDTW